MNLQCRNLEGVGWRRQGLGQEIILLADSKAQYQKYNLENDIIKPLSPILIELRSIY